MEDIPGLQEWNQKFTELFLGQQVEKVHLFNVNPNYFAFDEDCVWVLDGGIQFNLAGGSAITYCWHKEMELMDMIEGKPEVLFGDLDFYEIEDVSEKVNRALAGKAIKSVDIEWNWYQKMNEDFELEEELNFAPLGLLITLDDDSTLQLGAIQFAVNSDDKSLAKASYLPEGDLLVAVNERIDIILPEDKQG
jgi:hypothetical protein